ncbi:MAG TPA: MATE family efflux transporter [Candidatus Akkermansia intestinavium]|nr:MATE family efflux transporter [Candidatus Akkermansia intestinavium]
MAKDLMLQKLEKESVGRLLWQYSLPAVIGLAAVSAYNIIDSIFVGQWCSPFAVAALALTFPVMNLTIAFGTLVGLGTAATASITLGQHDYERAFRVLGHCVILGIIVGIVVGWAPLPWLHEILEVFGARGEALEEAYNFMFVIMLGFPLSTCFLNLNHLMRASGYPRKAMLSLLITMVVNLIAAPIYMQVFGMGVSGAAWATITGQAVGLVWVLIHYFNKRQLLYFRRGIYKLNGKIVKRIFTVGLPPCLLNVCGCIITVVYNQLFLAYDGEMGVGAFGSVNRTLFFFVMIVLGVAQGMQPIAGYNLGMGQFTRVRRVLRLALISGFIISSVGFVLVHLFPREILELFAKESDENATKLIDLGAKGIILFSYFFPLVGVQVIISNFFQAIGRPVMSIFLSLSRQLVFLLPCLFVLPRFFGEEGVWFSQSASDLASVALSVVVLWLFLRHYMPNKDHTLPKLRKNEESDGSATAA